MSVMTNVHVYGLENAVRGSKFPMATTVDELNGDIVPRTYKLGNARPGTPEFTQRWKEIAKADPKGFEKSQHDFLYKKNFKGVLDYATSKGMDTSSRTIQKV